MITIQGTVEEIIFCNEINGYTVCMIRHEKGIMTAVGYMPFVNAGETLKVTGRLVTHPDYGEQVKVEIYEKLLPETSDELEKYLSSGVIKGIGPVTAARIIERFGDEAVNILQFNPERLSEIKGISFDKAVRIGQSFEEQKAMRAVVMFFQEFGISPHLSSKIYKVFGEKTIEEIKNNPYRLADEVFGIGFRTADRIARSIGIDPSSKYRLCSGIKYVLAQAASSGHTYLPEDKLKELTSQLLDTSEGDIGDALISLVMDRAVVGESYDEGRCYYLSAYYNAELGVCRRLVELSLSDFKTEGGELSARLESFQRREGIVLAPAQTEAVKQAVTSGVLIITGGPGTGKTTIIKGIIELFGGEGCSVALAAPTGRAAKRMSEATGYEAKTIHRLLEIGYMGGENELVFARNESNLLEAQAVIIDEMSMVDVLLMSHLLKAIPRGCRLILAGDVNQLPSVGPGNILKDLISAGLLKTVKLTEIFRQAAKSMIVTNAHRINKGEAPCLNAKDTDFYYIARNSAEGIIKAVLELCSRRLPDTFGYDPFRDIQVLTPTRKGPVGVTSLNIELQKALNPRRKGTAERPSRDYVFRSGDRVMQIRNNYNTRWVNGTGAEGFGVFNGDTGIIGRIDDEEQKITVVFEDEKTVDYDYGMLDELEPAFAVTIHKSQGSEFPAVIVPLHQGPPVLMTRNLLYTAITRARELVILVGAEAVLSEMIANDREAMRFSGLAVLMKRGLPDIV